MTRCYHITWDLRNERLLAGWTRGATRIGTTGREKNDDNDGTAMTTTMGRGREGVLMAATTTTAPARFNIPPVRSSSISMMVMKSTSVNETEHHDDGARVSFSQASTLFVIERQKRSQRLVLLILLGQVLHINCRGTIN